MRVIEQKMIAAIRAGRNWTSGNTQVVTAIGSQPLMGMVYLHGHHIATYGGLSKRVAFNDAGWQTATTKSRINAIAREFGVMGVYQKNFEWFFDDGTPFSNWKVQQCG